MDKIRHMDDPDARNLVMPSAGKLHVHVHVAVTVYAKSFRVNDVCFKRYIVHVE